MSYTIHKSFFSKEEIGEMQETMLTIAKSIFKRETGHSVDGQGLLILDAVVDALNEIGKVGELYDAFAYSTAFLRFISSKKLTTVTGEGYCFTNRCRIDLPHDTRRTYGWHQEVFYTIPKGNFIQTWAPLFRDTTAENGTIEIMDSPEKILPQTWTEKEGGATQVIVKEEALQPMCKVLEMEVGDLLVFSGYTVHRSGYNASTSPRYSLVGMYHSFNSEAQWPKPDFEMRGMSQKEYFNQFAP